MRYGLIVCSAARLFDSGMEIRPPRLARLSERWVGAIGKTGPLGRHGFGWRDRERPLVFRSPLTKESGDQSTSEGPLRPSRGAIMDSLDELRKDIGPEDELFFYYYGHAYAHGLHDIILSLEGAATKDDRFTFQNIVSEFYKTGFRKIFFILDTCHAGRQRQALNQYAANVCGLFASGKGDYAASNSDMGVVSDALLSDLDISRLHSGDIRIDRKKRGITIRRWFQAGINRIRAPEDMPTPPEIYGDLGNEEVLYPFLNIIPDGLNELSPIRSIYRKLHAILEECTKSDEWLSIIETYDKLSGQRLFWNREIGIDGNPEPISLRRIGELLDLLTSLDLLQTRYESGMRQVKLTAAGQQAARREEYNRTLLSAIESRALPDGVVLNDIREIAFSLMEEAQLPNAFYVGEKLLSSGHAITNAKDFKAAFFLLPYTQMFRKVTPDTVFPEFS